MGTPFRAADAKSSISQPSAEAPPYAGRDENSMLVSHSSPSGWRQIRWPRPVQAAAFDLIELHADDLRKEPLFNRKQRLARILSGGRDAIVYNEHITHDGTIVFEHACRLGLEGIVSKRLDAPYQSGPVKTWLKSKNPLSEAVRRETEESHQVNHCRQMFADVSCGSN